jgi:hypothetical protein
LLVRVRGVRDDEVRRRWRLLWVGEEVGSSRAKQ